MNRKNLSNLERRRIRRKNLDPWFDQRAHFNLHGQTYQTLATRNPSEISKAINSIVENPQELTVIEFGPGINPFIDKIPFKKRIFVDNAKQLLERMHFSSQAKRQVVEESEKIVEKIQQVRRIKNKTLAGEKPKRFGLTVVNEVLTHVPPQERKNTIDGLANSSDRLVISERYGLPAKNLMQFKLGVNQHYVNPEKLAKRLVQKGFEVKIWLYPQNVSPFPESYFIIMAKRSNTPKVIETREKSLKFLKAG